MIPVHFPDDPFVDTEALAAEKAFREFAASREYPAWAALERARAGYAQLDAHVKAWRQERGKRSRALASPPKTSPRTLTGQRCRLY